MIRSLDEILSAKFDKIEITKILQSPEKEKEKFFLAIQFIYNNDNEQQQKNGLHLLNSRIRQIDTSEIVHEELIASLLESSKFHTSNTKHQKQVRQILQFIVNRASDKRTFTMAIQRRLITQVEQESHATTTSSTTKSLEEVVNYIDMFTLQASGMSLEEPLISQFCNNIIQILSEAQMRHDAESISYDKLYSQKISEFFSHIGKFCEQAKINVLQRVYEILILPQQKEVSGAVALALNVVPENLIGSAVLHLLNNVNRQCNQDAEIFNAINRLCQYHRFITAPIDVWIIKVIELLHNDKQVEILTRIIESNVKNLVISILMAVTRVKSLRILKAMLATRTYTESIITPIMNRSLQTLEFLRKDSSESEFNRDIFVDTLTTIAEYMHFCPAEFKIDNGYVGFMKTLVEIGRAHDLYFDSIAKIPRLSNATNNVDRKVGLENLGNTCYLNSVIQALHMTKPFSTEILKMDRQCRDITALQQILALLTFSDRSYVNIKFAIDNIRPTDFIPGYQQDSTEFMGSLLDRVHEADKKCIKLENGNDEMETQETCDSKLSSTASKMIVDNADNLKNPSIIYKHFGGKLQTTCVCSTCNTKSINIDSIRDLQLSFPEKDKTMEEDWDLPEPEYSVQKLLDFYFETEQLNLENQYRCDTCKGLCDGTRYTELLAAPKHLILTLKHFHYDPKFHTRSKLLIKNMIHDKDISVRVKAAQDGGSWRVVHYKLYAAVVHSGMSLDSGHYYTFAQNDDRWFKFNDSYVTKSDIDELHNLDPLNTPYILFYRRVSSATSTLPNPAATNHVEQPADLDFMEIPSYLKTFVLEDNDSFHRENSKSFRMKFQSPVKSWNNEDDPPPPSSCGNNFNNMQTNRFIF